MSEEDAPEVAESAVDSVSPDSGAPTGDNPAWNDFLSSIPQSMHDMVKPHLSKWDAGVQDRINAVHSQYEDFKPFKEAGISRDLLEQAYGIYDAINSDPQKVYEILGQTYGFGNQPPAVEQGQVNPQPNSEQTSEYDIGQGGQFNPEMERLQTMTETMANIILQQENERQAQAADMELDRELKGASDKYGAFDEKFVLSYMQTGMPLEDAVKEYHNMRNEVLTNANRPQAPNVINGGGQLPSNSINPAALSTKDTKSLVAAMMRAQNQQGV